MGALPQTLAEELRDRFGLARAIETGTYRGRGTKRLAGIFPTVATIEISPELARAAAEMLSGLRGVQVHVGSSRDVLPTLVDPTVPTLYWLDGHWSGGATGASDECPLLAEIDAISGGNVDDCILIDDARMFLAPPPPPHSRDAWPSYRQVEDALAAAKPGNATFVAHDIIVCLPDAAADAAAKFAAGRPARFADARERLCGVLARL